jgi:hypothetical protein
VKNDFLPFPLSWRVIIKHHLERRLFFQNKILWGPENETFKAQGVLGHLTTSGWEKDLIGHQGAGEDLTWSHREFKR